MTTRRTFTEEYKRNRKELLRDHPTCHWCKRRPATEADHVIPHDAGGPDTLDNLVPACKPCNSERGTRYLNAKRTRTQQERNKAIKDQQVFFVDSSITPSPSFSVSEGNETEPTESPAMRPASGPSGVIEPRLVTPVRAGQSYASEVADWARTHLGKELMAWQVLALEGQLAHDDAGDLVHRESLVSCARQQGKSVALTALIGWALTRWPVHRGAPVSVLSTANKLDRAVAIFLELADTLEAMGAKVIRAYGRNRVTMPDGSDWEVRAAVPGLHGMSPTLIVVDELWNIREDVYFDALRPSQIAQRSPLLSSWSTAGDEGSIAMLRLREQALAAIDADRSGRLFFAEWSMPPGVKNPMDPANWGWANPALGTTVTLDALQAAAETPDRGAFLRAHCNLWVSAANAWIPPGMWDDRRVDPVTEPGGWLTVESSVDESKFLGIRTRLIDGKVVVSVEFVTDSSWALWEKVEEAMADPKLQLAVAASMEIHVPERLQKRKTIWGYHEILKWTGLVRSMILEGRLVHTGEQLLAEHVNRAVLAKTQGGATLSSQKSPGPIEAARAMVVGAALCSKPATAGKVAFGFAS